MWSHMLTDESEDTLSIDSTRRRDIDLPMEDQAPKFAFVTWGELGKPKSVDKKLIRSHCMRGRNRREPMEQPIAQWLGHDDALDPSARSLLLSFSVSPMYKDRKDPKIRRSTTRRKCRILTPQQLHAKTAASNIIPCPIPNLPLLRFADNLDPESVELLFTGWFVPRSLSVRIKKVLTSFCPVFPAR